MDQLDGHVKRLLSDSGATAAVIWTPDATAGNGSVLYAFPAGILPTGLAWPPIPHSEAGRIQRDPTVLAGLVPVSLGIELPRWPRAALSMPLGDSALSLLLVWSDASVGDVLPDNVQRRIAGEIADNARAAWSERRAEESAERLEAVLGILHQGVVAVDHNRGLATVNPAAAGLLGLPTGELPAGEFAAAMQTLLSRTLDQAEVATLGGLLLGGTQGPVDCVLRFPIVPTHLRLSSRPFRQGAYGGRVWILEDLSPLCAALESVQSSNALMQASADSMLDPQVLFEAVRDSAGHVVDFRYISANRAACHYLQIAPENLVGSRALDTLPNLEGSGLLARYGQCLADGEPLILTDFPFFNDVLDDVRCYDIRAARAGADLLSLTWSDVTERFRSARRLSESEQNYRLLAENVGDAITHVRDGVFVWVSPSVSHVLGATAEYWLGREVLEVIPPEDIAAFNDRMEILAAGGAFQRRIRVRAADGVIHWVHVHAKPFFDAEGHRDGYTGAMRLIDDEVAAEKEIDEANRERARADALFRRSMVNAAVGMCLADLEGRFLEVNPALCEFFGYDPEALKQMTWQELTAPAYLQDNLDNRARVMAGDIDSYRMVKQYIHADGHPIWGDLAVSCLRHGDGRVETFIGQITDITAEIETRMQLHQARRRQAAADALYRRSTESATIGMALTDQDGHFVEVNAALCEFFGHGPETLKQLTWQELTAADHLQAELDNRTRLIAGDIESYQMRTKQYIHADGRPIWAELSVACVRDAEGEVEFFIRQVVDVTREVEMRQQLEVARRRQTAADALYRRSIDGAAVGLAMADAEGTLIEVNGALCEFFGYDAETMPRMPWQELTAPDYRDADLSQVYEMLAGRIDSYRILKQFLHADGHLLWGDLSVSCIRDEQGGVERFVSQVVDVTAAVEADARNVVLNQQLTDELRSAATYMGSIMPDGLTGGVDVSSRYLPSQELGGDCFDYVWIDDDHLIVYLIDVSGHGLEPALLAASLQNILRSGSFAAETMRDPGAVLAQLNRQFQMEQQDNHYFTMWFGAYDRQTRTLRYASAGAPPALAFGLCEADVVTVTELTTPASPVGVFEDTEFITDCYPVPPGCRILVYSDGASDLDLADGGQLSSADFRALTTRVAGAPDWTLDELIGALRGLTPDGTFDDDCSLIRLAFD